MAYPDSIPRGLYIHLPWCVRKCPYCDFNSYEGAAVPERRYVDALMQDLDCELAHAPGRPVSSIFLGGGTPSLFSGDGIGAILEGVRARVTLMPDCEVTLEANPGASEAERFHRFREAGVTRLSLGVQSFDDDCLRALGRIHDGRAAAAAIEAARASGFRDLNIDLMYGLPGQDVAGFEQDLARALAFAPEHLSVYQLTLEPGTPFAHRPPVLPAEDGIAEMEARLAERMTGARYARYEVSAYAQPGHACRHNLNYWTFGDYLGIGAGAHGKISHKDGIWRHQKIRQPEAYMRDPTGSARRWRLGPEEIPFEFMLNATRLIPGFAAEYFPEHTGMPLGELERALAPARTAGLLWTDSGRIGTTALGLRFLNDLQALFLPEPPPSRASSA